MAIWTGKCRFGSWNYETDFLYLLQNLRKDKEEKKKIYRSLGAMGGILLAILFW